jgi:hypothetical protein
MGDQDAGRQPRVLRFLSGHLGRRLDRQPVQLRRGRAVVQAADLLGRHPPLRGGLPPPVAAARRYYFLIIESQSAGSRIFLAVG